MPARFIYTKHIGRVGALAVALGVGFALSTPAGFACADDDGRGGGTSSSTGTNTGKAGNPSGGADKSHESQVKPGTTAAPGTSGGRQPTARRHQHSLNTTDATKTTSGTPAATNTDEPLATGVTTLADPVPTVPHSGRSGAGTTVPPLTPSKRQRRDNPKDPKPSAAVLGKNPAAPQGQSGPHAAAAVEPSTPRVSALNSAPTARTLAATNNLVTTNSVVTTNTPVATSTGPINTTVTTTSPQAHNPVGALLAIPGAIVTTMMNALKPLLLPGGSVPANPPLAWAVLAWVRRQFINDAPQFSTATVAPHANGTTSVDVNAADPDGDKLTYTATNGAHGTVTVDRSGDADGSTFTYTPDAGYVGTDTFTITASDAGNGGHLVDLFTPGGARSTTTTITVAPAAAPQVDATNPSSIDASQAGDPAGSVRGHVNVTGATGYSGPADPPTGTLTVNPDGSFLYTPAYQARHDAAADGVGPLTDTFSVTATNSIGNVVVPVTVTVTPYNSAPVAPETPGAQFVEHTDGTVTGNLDITDADGDTLIYTATDPLHGTVTIDANGNYTYTPNGQARLDAYSASSTAPTPFARFAAFSAAAAPSPTTDSFTVTATDAHGGSTTSAITVPVDPISAAVINKVAVPDIGYEAAVGADGTTVLAKNTGTGTPADPYQVKLVVVYPNGTTRQSTVTPNYDQWSDVEVGANGTVAYTTRTGTGTALDPYKTTLVVLHPDGTTTNQVADQPASTQVGADGTAAFVSAASGQTTVTVVRPDGGITTKTITGQPRIGGAIAADGTFAVTTYNPAVYSYDNQQTTLTVIRPDGTTDTVTTAGFPNYLVQLSDNGTVLYSTLTGNGTSANPTQSAVTVVAPDGTITTRTVSGQVTTQIGTDGTAAFSSQTGSGTVADPYRTTLTVIHPDGTVHSASTFGSIYGPVLLAANGTAVSTSYGIGNESASYGVYVLAIRPTGTIFKFDAVGTPSETRVGADGTIACAFNRTGQTGVFATAPDDSPMGGIYTTRLVDFQVGADGTTAITTQSGSGTTQDPSQTSVTILATDGTVTNRTVAGQSWATFVGADGTVYLAATPDAGDRINMLINRPSGATTTTTVLGTPAVTMVAPDGKAYVTTSAASTYTVTTIGIANDVGHPPNVDPANPCVTDPALPGDPAGTVRGHINSPQNSGWTFTGSTTTAHGTLTVNPDGTYVYTPTDEARHLAAAEGPGPLTDTFVVTVSNANGSTPINVTVPVGPPLNTAPTAPVTPPTSMTDHANGQVSSGLGWTDGDGDTLTYSGPAGGTTSRGGTVVLNPDGTYTYTPSVQVRLDAYSTPGTDTDTFDITVSDGHGGHITTPVTVTIDPVGAAIVQTTSTAVSGSMYGTQVGADGTELVMTRAGSGTTADPYRYTATIIRPDGTTTITPLVGAQKSTQVSANGTSVITMTGGTGTVADPYKTTVTIVAPNGSTAVRTVVGKPYQVRDTQVADDGTVTLTTYTGSGAPGDPASKTTVTVLRPNGAATTSAAITGTPFSTQAGSYGTAVTTYSGTGTAANPYTTRVTIVRPDGSVTTTSSIPGDPYPNDYNTIAANGTTAIATHAGTGSTTDPYRDTVTIVRADGTTTTRTVAGALRNGPTVGSDGTIAFTYVMGSGTTADPLQYFATVIRPDGTAISRTFAEPFYGQARVGADGTVAITTQARTSTAYLTTVTVMRPDGDVVVGPTIDGSPNATSAPVGTDGTVALATYTAGYQTTVTVIHPDGSISTSPTPISGLPSVTRIGADGTAYQPLSSGGNTSFVIVRPSGATTITALPGAFSGFSVAPDGTTYATTQLNGTYTVTMIKVAPEPA